MNAYGISRSKKGYWTGLFVLALLMTFMMGLTALKAQAQLTVLDTDDKEVKLTSTGFKQQQGLTPVPGEWLGLGEKDHFLIPHGGGVAIFDMETAAYTTPLTVGGPFYGSLAVPGEDGGALVAGYGPNGIYSTFCESGQCGMTTFQYGVNNVWDMGYYNVGDDDYKGWYVNYGTGTVGSWGVTSGWAGPTLSTGSDWWPPPPCPDGYRPVSAYEDTGGGMAVCTDESGPDPFFFRGWATGNEWVELGAGGSFSGGGIACSSDDTGGTMCATAGSKDGTLTIINWPDQEVPLITDNHYVPGVNRGPPGLFWTPDNPGAPFTVITTDYYNNDVIAYGISASGKVVTSDTSPLPDGCAKPTGGIIMGDSVVVSCSDDDGDGVVVTISPGKSEPPPPTYARTGGAAGASDDPVATATGELFFGVTDLAVGGGPLPVRFERYYASLLETGGWVKSALGTNWMHNFDLRLDISGSKATVVYYGGNTIPFVKSEGAWGLSGSDPVPYRLVEKQDGFALLDPNRALIHLFSAEGRFMGLEDRNGNSLALSYDDQGRPGLVEDGLGRSLQFTYDDGRLTGVQDQTGRGVAFQYDGDDLAAVIDPRGNTTTYAYTKAGNQGSLLVSATRPLENTPFTQVWDSQGRVVSQTDSAGNTTAFAYDAPSPGTTTMTDPLGYQVRHTHEDQLRLTGHTDPDGESFSVTYDAAGRRIGLTDRLLNDTAETYHTESGKIASFKDALGNSTYLQYSPQVQGDFTFHNLSLVQYPDGTTISFIHDTSGNLVTFTDRAGGIWEYAYNNRGQVVTARNPAGGEWQYAYNNEDATLAQITDPAGNTVSFSYDPLKRLIKIEHADGAFRTYTYDQADNLTALVDERGQTRTFEYDKNNNLSGASDPTGFEITQAYNGNDLLTSMVDGQDRSVVFTYDAMHRLQTVTNPMEETATLAYDGHGRLISTADPEGYARVMTHNQEGILTSFTAPLDHTWSYSSDSVGRVIGISSPLQFEYNFQYDVMGRVTGIISPLGLTTSLTYDGRGLKSEIDLPGGIAASFERNELGHITRITDPNGHFWDRTYDAGGRLLTSTDPLGNVTSYGYDQRNLVASVTHEEGSQAITRDEAGNITRRLYDDGTDIQYTYDGNGRLLTADGLTIEYDDRGEIVSSSGLEIGRDEAGRMTQVTLAPGKTVTYAYDGRGLVTQVKDWLGQVTNLNYDKEGRLVSLARPNDVNAAYSHDHDGNLEKIQETFGFQTLSSIELTRDGEGKVVSAVREVPLSPDLQPLTRTFSYDDASRVGGYTYDAAGRLLADGVRTYSWDQASRLVFMSGGGKNTSFSYDGLGMRIGRTTEEGLESYVVNYALGLPSVAVARVEGNEGMEDSRYYVHLPGGELLYFIEAVDETSHFYHFDETGTALFLTDDQGTVTDSYDITPYGEVTARTGSTYNPFTFQGAFGVMEEGGLYYMRARYYHPETARFLSPDPVHSLHPAEINPYQYARANPMRFIDPMGTSVWSAVKGTAKGAVGVARGTARTLGTGVEVFYEGCSALVERGADLVVGVAAEIYDAVESSAEYIENAVSTGATGVSDILVYGAKKGDRVLEAIEGLGGLSPGGVQKLEQGLRRMKRFSNTLQHVGEGAFALNAAMEIWDMYQRSNRVKDRRDATISLQHRGIDRLTENIERQYRENKISYEEYRSRLILVAAVREESLRVTSQSCIMEMEMVYLEGLLKALGTITPITSKQWDTFFDVVKTW